MGEEKCLISPIGNSNNQRFFSICSVFNMSSLSVQLKQWNLTNHECLRTIQAHRGWVRAIACSHNGETITTVGDDKTIKHWTTDAMADRSHLPINTISTEVCL